MDVLKVLITGAGAPGIRGTLYSIKNNPDNRKIYTIGTDIKPEVVGKYLCNKFYKIPPPESDLFITSLLDICEKEKVDVILPQVTRELIKLSENKKVFENIGTAIAISDPNAIKIANNKFHLMELARKHGIPVPNFYLIKTWKELEKTINKLGWPELPVVIKPPISSGMRGLRIINEKIDKKELFHKEKPTSVYVKKEDLLFLGEKFDPLLVMEYLPGDEFTVDVLSDGYSVLAVIPRRRDSVRCGITFIGTIIKDDNIIKYSTQLSKILRLSFAFGFQFKLDTNGIPKLIESNPRIQGTMVLSTIAGANIIYSAVKLALGETIQKFNIKWGTRFFRYWGGIGVLSDKSLIEI